MATIINSIDPITLEIQTYSPQDISVLSPEIIDSVFDSSRGDYVELTISSPNQDFQITDQNLENISITSTDASTGATFNVDLNPENELRTRGFTNGEYNVIYNFLRKELNSSPEERIFYIKEISSDRTELRLGTNNLTNTSLEVSVNDFKSILSANPTYFQDFYLNFGSNNLVIANNILVDTTKPKYEILINLYEPLPTQTRLKDTLWIVTKTADSLAFNIQFQPEVIVPKIVSPTLKSPNFNLPIKNRTNNSTNYINYEQLLNTNLVSSYDQILSYLEDKSVSVGIDYTDFSNFVHFSSAESRVNNFTYKVQLLEEYNKNLSIVESANTAITSSTIILQEKISNIIKNFDGFEYYLYYSSGSNTYPKSNLTPPYNLRLWGTTPVRNWYNSIIKSASIYDALNKDYLINTIPSYLTDDPQNEPYKVFIDMIGQYYDNIWIYYKDVSNRYSGDNRLEYGISKDLVADAIRSFGLKIYQNNFSVSDLFDAFTGFNPGSYTRSKSPNPLPTGYDGEFIDVYYTASQESRYTPIDDVNKEMYKRIYHNLPYLLKSKGTVAGLQNIISMFGITSSILSIKEFGGEWNSTKPVTGIKDIVNDNIQILTSAQMSRSFPPTSNPDGFPSFFTPSFVLSNQKSILQNYNTNNDALLIPSLRSLSPSVNTVEITFSPQNDIDNFIKSPGNLPNFNIGTYIGNPSQTFLPYYPDLQNIASSLLVNNELKPISYIRLIKYFDNSLFNMIKDFLPARTNLKSGITIKPHLLERSKIVQPQVFFSSSFYTGSINTAFISGGTGGTFNDYNPPRNSINNSQVWIKIIETPIGPRYPYQSDQSEFYNGELPYYSPISLWYQTQTVVTQGELNPDNTYKYASTTSIPYVTRIVEGSLQNFLSIGGASPPPGQIYYWGIVNTLTNSFKVVAIKVNAVDGNGVNHSDTLNNLFSITMPVINPIQNSTVKSFNVSIPSVIGNIFVYAVDSTPISPFLGNEIQSGFVTFIPEPGIIWDYYEYNPIINNTVADVTSIHYMDVDYGTGLLTPYNFDLLISLSASKAAVQDSNYSSKAWSNIRYNGSRASSYDFNIPV